MSFRSVPDSELFSLGPEDLAQMDPASLHDLRTKIEAMLVLVIQRIQFYDLSIDVAFRDGHDDLGHELQTEIKQFKRLKEKLKLLDQEARRIVNQHFFMQIGAEEKDDSGAFQRGINPNAFLSPILAIKLVKLGNGLIDSASFNVWKTVGKVQKSIRDAERRVKAAGKLYNDARQLYNDAKPMVGRVKQLGDTAKGLAAFERDEPLVGVAQPSVYYQSLMTVPAMTYLQLQSDEKLMPVVQFLGPDAVTHFCQRHETKGERKLRMEKTGELLCVTQTGDGVSAVVEDDVEKVQTIHLWASGSELRWRMVDDTFKSQTDFTMVENAMFASTGAWNKIAPGGVKFKDVGKDEPADFLVVFHESGTTSLASSFFPGEYTKGYSTIRIFSAGVQEGAIDLSNQLCHELGHVLGFHHMYELFVERNRKLRKAKTTDSLSVMSYEFPSKLNLADVMTTRGVYETFSGQGHFELEDGNERMLKFQVERISV